LYANNYKIGGVFFLSRKTILKSDMKAYGQNGIFGLERASSPRPSPLVARPFIKPLAKFYFLFIFPKKCL